MVASRRHKHNGVPNLWKRREHHVLSSLFTWKALNNRSFHTMHRWTGITTTGVHAHGCRAKRPCAFRPCILHLSATSHLAWHRRVQSFHPWGPFTLIAGPHPSSTSMEGVERYSQDLAAKALGLEVSAPTGHRSTTLPLISDANAASTYVPISIALPRPTAPSMSTPATSCNFGGGTLQFTSAVERMRASLC
eukprot:scaffold217766_cov32-Tisochrysis_lutea.AAC.2